MAKRTSDVIDWILFRRIMRYALVIVITASFILNGYFFVKAEQVGNSPQSNSTSRIKSVYDDLSSAGYGSDVNTPNWGNFWNRIYTAAIWTPNGNATAEDVVNGKTFFGNSRTLQTGTAASSLVGGCDTQDWHDSYGASVTEASNCSLTWTTASSPVAGDDNRAGRGGKDPRTGLIWSQQLYKSGTTVVFHASSGSSFSWDASAVANQGITSPVAGNRTAKELCADQGNGWRLPTQKELMQAYIDGSYFNLSQPAAYFWSAPEASATSAWSVYLSSGYTFNPTKGNTSSVRCVRPGN